MTSLVGHSLGRYTILEQLGEGGMATVYKAYDTRLERDVAVKVIRKGAFPPEQLERILKRFEREAKALARLTHPNIVPVIDYGEHDGAPYLVMPFLPGGTLKQRLGQPLPWQEALRLLLPIARALDYAHTHNILHRDVKPSNILLTENSEPMLTDFGIAKILDLEDGQTLTATGVGVGTPEYMSPEQGLGKPVGPQADVYSLGVVLYELLTGRKPYTADTPMAVVLKQATEPLPRPGQFVPDLPETVEKILLKALAKDPADRYTSMGEFAAAMQRALTASTVPVQPPSAVRRPPSDLPSTDDAATIDQGVTGETVLQEEDRRRQTAEPLSAVRRPPSAVSSPPSTPEPPRPRWLAVLWIALDWAIALVVGEIIWESGWQLGWAAWAIVGAIGGLLTALVLRGEKMLSWEGILGLTLGWGIGGAIGGTIISEGDLEATIGLATVGTIGGLLTALVLRKEKRLSSQKDVLWLALGWGIEKAIGLLSAMTIYELVYISSDIFLAAIAGAIGGAIGGAVTIWRLRAQKPPAPPPV